MAKICPIILVGMFAGTTTASPSDLDRMQQCKGEYCAWYTGEGCAVLEIAKKPKTAKEYFQRGCVALATDMVLNGEGKEPLGIAEEAKP